MGKVAALDLGTQAKEKSGTSSLPQTRGDNQALESVIRYIQSQLIGQERVIELALATLVSKGHILLEGPPGVGKTSLARTLANCFHCQFNRLQMTSDLLPGEVVGIMRPTADGKDFEFRKGPIFTNFLLADELNRTSPKTQAALLEAMAEKTVSVDGSTHTIQDPFFVIATQNPSESHGVYPLAESQLDRFTTQVLMELPSEVDEIKIYQIRQLKELPTAPSMTVKDLQKIQSDAEKVFVEQSVLEYALTLARHTRTHTDVMHGISIRGVHQFISVAKGLAFLRGRNFVTPDDLKDAALPALAHRLKLNDDSWEVEPKRAIIKEILETTQAPK